MCCSMAWSIANSCPASRHAAHSRYRVHLFCAIAASLAAGCDLAGAVARSKRFIHEAIRSNPGLGHGSGPVNHHAEVS
ncbi:MAG: bifunctional hydroxymethylpyrimidine kinase/phosphomethylpyrimidine kinase [Ignavibacteriota bacterium]